MRRLLLSMITLVAAVTLVRVPAAQAAGNCDVESTGQHLLVDCDDADNRIEITEGGGAGSGTYTVTGTEGTAINGTVNGSVDVSEVNRDLRIDLEDGADEVKLSGFATQQDVRIDGGRIRELRRAGAAHPGEAERVGEGRSEAGVHVRRPGGRAPPARPHAHPIPLFALPAT